MTNDRAAVLALFRFWSFRPSFVICHSSFSVDISRPNEFADQSLSGALRARVVGDGPGDPDATAKERRPGCSIWRRSHGKYFRRANHQCAGEVHDLAGRDFLCAHARVVDPLCSQEHGRQRVPARTDENASCAAKFAGACGSKALAGRVAGEYACSEFTRRFCCA